MSWEKLLGEIFYLPVFVALVQTGSLSSIDFRRSVSLYTCMAATLPVLSLQPTVVFVTV